MQFSSLGSSKMEISETDLFDTLTIQKDEISYVKHVLAPLYVFCTLFGCWGGGGVTKGWGTTCLCSFIASAVQKWSSLSPLRGALPKAIEFYSARLAPLNTQPHWGGGGGGALLDLPTQSPRIPPPTNTPPY